MLAVSLTLSCAAAHAVPHPLPTIICTDRIVERISGFASALGNAAKCDPWAVEIFAEEVVRGGPAFAISLVISAIEPTLRQLAELGAWQVMLTGPWRCNICFASRLNRYVWVELSDLFFRLPMASASQMAEALMYMS